MEPTQKQLDFIKIIEGYVVDRFTGSTKKEASEWIDAHYEIYTETRRLEDEAMNFSSWALEHGYI